MSTIKKMILHQAQTHGVQPWVVEKDYALSYLLLAVITNSDHKNSLALKGGTALRKIYFEGFRFSEDLDFSTVAQVIDLNDLIATSVEIMEKILKSKGPFEIGFEEMTLRESHPGGQSAFFIRVQFPYHRKPMCRLKIEITIDEPLLLAPEQRPIIHEFPEFLEAKSQTYSLVEIVAEKLRALLQSKVKIQDRGWGGARIPRDYYDLWYVLKAVDLSNRNLTELVRRKASHRNVNFKSLDDFFAPVLVDTAVRMWTKQLLQFVPNAPMPENVLGELRDLLEQVMTTR